VESVNIVKGPATAVQGASMSSVVHRPHHQAPVFRRQKTAVSLTLGSYDTKRWSLDTGGPINKELAYRLSYSGEDSTAITSMAQEDQLAVRRDHLPSERHLRTLINAQAFVRYTENWGINRVTQDLIDHGNYVTGIISTRRRRDAVRPAELQVRLGGGNVIAYGPTVGINRNMRLLAPATFLRHGYTSSDSRRTRSDRTAPKNSPTELHEAQIRSAPIITRDHRSLLVRQNRTEFIVTKKATR